MIWKEKNFWGCVLFAIDFNYSSEKVVVNNKLYKKLYTFFKYKCLCIFLFDIHWLLVIGFPLEWKLYNLYGGWYNLWL